MTSPTSPISAVTEPIAADLDKASQYLAETRDALLDAVTPLSDAQWTFKASPDRWSIAEIIEHLVLLEEFFLQVLVPRLLEAPPGAPDRDPRQADAFILAWVPDARAEIHVPGRVPLSQAPQPLLPAGRWTPQESLRRLLAGRMQTAVFLQSTSDLRRHVVNHLALGPLDGYQWVLFIAAHSARHVRQIRETAADPLFPAREDVVEAGGH